MSPIAVSKRRRFVAAPSAVGPRGLPRPLALTFSMNMFTHITMTRATPQSPTDTAGRHLLLFDGHCGLCTAFVQFILPRDRGGIFRFASLSSPDGRATVTRHGGDA